MRVPLDYANPGGAQVDIAVIRLPAKDQSRRIGSLVVNPGGPGGSGVDFVASESESLPQELRDRFDIVGFDPRGVGQSDPLNCNADMPAYLEASSPRNKALYERHGFVEVGLIQAGSSPPMWPMLRPARA